LKDVDYSIQLETRNWRNSGNVSKYFQLKYIDEQTHRNWLEQLKEENPKIIAFLIKYNEKYIGITYFHSIDYKNKVCDWGIYIYNENNRGLGLGQKALEVSLDYAKNNLKMKKVYLEVLEDNVRAKSLYKKLGFKFFQQKTNVLRFEKNL
jgi:UDP-4-amino-4,6-dideoxy-N-acetyl-beta-L-altrosamine N-acetyltransferase